jgi:hypothetical protein
LIREIAADETVDEVASLDKALHQSFKTSLPALVIDGDSNKLVGMVSAWGVPEKLVWRR